MKKLLSKVSLLSAAALTLPVVAMAQSIELNTLASSGLGTQGLTETVASIIQVIIGFLGVVAIIIILIGGFKWMTSGGNEEKVGEAKKLLSAGVIGLIIILAAYAITTFVISALVSAT
jgi:type IV secretory pathway VirB2 component (pilin)